MNQYLKIAWNASLTALVITLLAGLFVLAMPPVYRATATVTAGSDNLVQFRSAELLSAVIESTGVDPLYLQSLGDRLLDREASSVNLLQQRLSVKADRDNDWIEVSVEARDPGIAAELANAVTTEFLQRTAGSRLPDERREAIARELAEAEEKIVAYQSENPDVRNPAALESSLDRRARDIEGRVRALESELVAAQTELAIIGTGDLAPLSNDPETRRVVQKQQQLLTRKAELSARYGPRHQKMTALESELIAVAAQVEDLTIRAENRSSLSVRTLRERLNTLEEEQADIESQRLHFDRVRAQLNELMTKRDRLQLALRGENADVDTSRFSAAVAPDSSLRSGQVRLMLLVFAASFILVAGIQLIRPAK